MGLGLFSMQAAVACEHEGNLEMACCQSEISNQALLSTPGFNPHIGDSHNHGHSCKDTCPSCYCLSISVTPGMINKEASEKNIFENPNPNSHFYIREGISSGYLSIWRPPKIG